MTELEFNTTNIIDALSVTLDNVFNSDGDRVTIYSEDIEQGFEAPCIYIKLLSSTSQKQINKRWLRHYHFDIHYFPISENGEKGELFLAGDKITRALDFIENGEYKYHGENISSEIIDGVLHVNATYWVFVRDPLLDIDEMQHLTQHQTTI